MPLRKRNLKKIQFPLSDFEGMYIHVKLILFTQTFYKKIEVNFEFGQGPYYAVRVWPY